MEMKRRTFTKVILAAATGGAGALWHRLCRVSPPRLVRAARAKIFPGKVIPLRDEEISKPGPWAG
jgi:hypothetical protein